MVLAGGAGFLGVEALRSRDAKTAPCAARGRRRRSVTRARGGRRTPTLAPCGGFVAALWGPSTAIFSIPWMKMITTINANTVC